MQHSLVECDWHIAHTWSLAFEEQFYFLFPLLLLWRVRRGWRLAVWATAALAAALPALAFPLDWIGRTGFVAVYSLFGLGYWFANHEGCWRQWQYPNLVFWISALICLFPWSMVHADRIAPLFYVIAVPCMVLAVDHGRFWLSRMFTLPSIALLGQASYSMYLWQEFFAGPVFGSVPIAWNVLMIAAMIGACVVLYLNAERPLIAYSWTLGRHSAPLLLNQTTIESSSDLASRAERY